MLDLYPEIINVRGYSGCLPIHCAASVGGGTRSTHTQTIELLLKHNPTSIKEVVENWSGPGSNVLPFHMACILVESAQVLYDAYPEAILAGSFSNQGHVHREVLAFERNAAFRD